MNISAQRSSINHLAISKLVCATLVFCMATVLPGCTTSRLDMSQSAGLQSGDISLEPDSAAEGQQVAMVVPPPEPVVQPQAQPEVQPEPEAKPSYNQDDVLWIQQRLQDLGYYDGDIDGSAGQVTRSAIEEYQQEQGVESDGQPTAKLREYMWRNGG